MKTSRLLTTAGLALLLTSLPGPIIYLTYSWSAKRWPSLLLEISDSKTSIAEIMASFSFTLLGMLAAFVTIMFTMGGSKTFAKYKDRGYLTVFLIVYFWAITTLALCFATALISSAESTSAAWLRISMALGINSLVMIVLISSIVIRLSSRAVSE